jgi:hypothetical protein
MMDPNRTGLPSSPAPGWHVHFAWVDIKPEVLQCLRLSTFVLASDLHCANEHNAVAWAMATHAAPIALAFGVSPTFWSVESIKPLSPQESS